MGFFDSFKEGFEKGNQEAANRQQYSEYQREKQKEREHHNRFNNQSDGVLLNKMRDTFTSNEDKAIIDNILKGRGYRKAINGTYHRL